MSPSILHYNDYMFSLCNQLSTKTEEGFHSGFDWIRDKMRKAGEFVPSSPSGGLVQTRRRERICAITSQPITCGYLSPEGRTRGDSGSVASSAAAVT
ncbi:hypothetical protein NDU88_006997 [Pleurodeles waltl]|uniref:Uncharacterized protein n=1 Tax=Pleurodeles waltl TaxID=8319 RepID=A0AAV7LSD2_PLEWA|nr:hypothetical protein NDU88_006997 [Pleurodeles waltl]